MKSLKPAFASNVTFVDHIRAESGDAQAQFDNRTAVIYTAAFHLMKSGNKTQFNLVQSAIGAHATEKACRAEGQKTANAASRHAFAVYQAYGAALAQCGVPAFMPKAEHATIDDAAAVYATEFVSVVTLALMPAPKAEVSEADKAAKAEAKVAKEAEAKAATDAAIKAEAEKLANASVVTLADMVRIVANAASTGMLDAEALALLDGALDAVAANISYVPAGEAAPVQAAA